MTTNPFCFCQQVQLLLFMLLMLASSFVRTESLFGARNRNNGPFRRGPGNAAAVDTAGHGHGHGRLGNHHFYLRAGSTVDDGDKDGTAPDLETTTTNDNKDNVDNNVDPNKDTDSMVTNDNDDTTTDTGAEQEHPEEGVLIVMDGFCPYHGVYVATMADQVPGITVLPILSDYLWNYLRLVDPDTDYPRMPQSDEDWEGLMDYVKGKTVVGVYCESDSGLSDAEIMREKLQVQCRDDPDVNEARRNKFLMNQVVGEAGLQVAKQKLCHSIEEAREFARELMKAPPTTTNTTTTNDVDDDVSTNSTATSSSSDANSTATTRKSKSERAPRRVVVKPFRGVASEAVHMCENVKQVKEACRTILSSPIFGAKGNHDTVLVQEFLVGYEYAVDVVSRNGQHKVAAVWRYDKRPANGASFVYFQTELVDCDMDPDVQAVCDYAIAALNALGVKWGLSHNEMIVTDKGPTLVEVNCRQHNMDFCPLTMVCIGYNALDMTLEAFLGSDEDWDRFPDLPCLRAHGSMVHLVNTQSGYLHQVKHLQEMHDLPSVMNWQVYDHFSTQGELIEPTVDIRTDAGWVQMVNEDPGGLQRDYEQVVAWMPTMFELADEASIAKTNGGVDEAEGEVTDEGTEKEVEDTEIEATDEKVEVVVQDEDTRSSTP
jgi:hypothetical protein